jgi:sec-independent protein translocase protein TatA
MISAPGPLELIVILVIALIFLGPKRLPDAARSLGAGVREFRDSLSGEREEHGYDDEPDEDDEDEDDDEADPDEDDADDLEDEPEDVKDAAKEAVRNAAENDSAGDPEPVQKQS